MTIKNLSVLQGGHLPNLNRWLRPYNVQEILCGQCGSTVPSANAVEIDICDVKNLIENAIRFEDKVRSFDHHTLL